MLVRDKRFYIRYFSLLLPMALQSLILFSVNLADNIMIGGYSEISLSGVALANQVQFVLQMLAGGICEGVIVLGSQYWGKSDKKSISRIIGLGVKAELLLSIVFFILVNLFAGNILGLMTTYQEVVDEGIKYLRIISYTYFFFCITNVLLASLRCVETVRIGLYSTSIALVVNIILNYMLIYGNLGAPRLGVSGAAIGTLCARIVEFAFIICYVFFIDKKLKLRIKSLLSMDFFFIKDYLKAGLPIIISNFLWSLGSFSQASILGRLGSDVIAANSIANTLFQIISVVTYASCSVAAVTIGKTVGTGDYDLSKAYSKTIQIMSLVIGIASGTALFFAKAPILSLYSLQDSTKLLAGSFINLLCITIIGTSYQTSVIIGIIRGGGDTKFVLFNDMIFVWLVVIPSASLAAFVFNLQPVYVFMFLKCDQILKCAVAFVKVNCFKWIKPLTRQLDISDNDSTQL